MTALEIVETVEQVGGFLQAVGPERIRVIVPRDALTNALKAEVAEHKAELLSLLSASNKSTCADPYIFTDRGKLCDVCRGIGRVTVLDGRLCCTRCVEDHAERIARRGTGG